MKKKLGIAFLLTVVPMTTFTAFAAKPNYKELSEGPRIVSHPNQRMLVVTRRGDPAIVAKAAFQDLYQAFYANAGKAEKLADRNPRARWPVNLDESDRTAWVGRYALPVSDEFIALKSENVRIEVWDYGMVAEILHKGPYSNEAADINALKTFIAANGFSITGDHEEEYLRGPGALFKGNPSKYRTIIRYRVDRLAEPTSPVAKSAPADAGKNQ